MTETIEPMTAATDQQRFAQDLVEQARVEGVELVSPDGLLTGLTKNVLEAALEAELSEHLGYDKHEAVGRSGANSRNGTRSKTVITAVGPGADRRATRPRGHLRAGDRAQTATTLG